MWSDTYTYSTFMNTALLAMPSPLLLSLPAFNPLHKWTTPFYLLGDPLFGNRGANVHPHSSLVGDRLPTPCSLTLPLPFQQYPQFMLHVYRDNITTSITLSDTVIITISQTITVWNSNHYHLANDQRVIGNTLKNMCYLENLSIYCEISFSWLLITSDMQLGTFLQYL